MNKSSSFAFALTLVTLAAGSAFAQTAAPTVATKSRADVVAELRTAQVSGQYAAQSGGNYSDVVVAYPNVSANSRDQIRAELAAARASGEYSALTIGGDYRDPFATQTTSSTKTRAEVQAELAAARSNGEYAVLNAGDYSDRLAHM